MSALKPLHPIVFPTPPHTLITATSSTPFLHSSAYVTEAYEGEAHCRLFSGVTQACS